MSTRHVKICGLKTQESVLCAAKAKADYIGFVFYPPSPRNISASEASLLTKLAPEIASVAVTVDASDSDIENILRDFIPAFLQLHGSEPPARVRAIKEKFAIPVIKGVSVETTEDIMSAHAYESSVDMLLFDAKAPKGLPGGNGLAFNWNMLSGHSFTKPWFLSGGLNSNNVQQALETSGAKMVDVSSGVEVSPGIKSTQLIERFIGKVKSTS